MTKEMTLKKEFITLAAEAAEAIVQKNVIRRMQEAVDGEASIRLTVAPEYYIYLASTAAEDVDAQSELDAAMEFYQAEEEGVEKIFRDKSYGFVVQIASEMDGEIEMGTELLFPTNIEGNEGDIRVIIAKALQSEYDALQKNYVAA